MADTYFEKTIKEIEKSSVDKKLGLDTPFDTSKWINQTIEQKGLKQTKVTTYARKKSFKQICKTVRDELKGLIDPNDHDKRETYNAQHIEWLDRQHKAVIGDEQAMSQFIYQITEVLRKHNIDSEDYPSFYDSLSEAIFHEIWGVSILYKWEKYPESEAAVIRGTELWFDVDGKFVKQQEEFENELAVERVKRAFTLRSKDAVINDQSPELEIEREDGSRITMMQRPRSRQTYIMFRRFVVKDITLTEQAKRGTIPERDIDIYRALSRTMCNIVFAGRVRSAKTTFLKSMIRERSSDYVAAVMEKHFELRLTDHLKDRLVFEVQAKEGDLHNAMPRLLRMEHDYIVVGEIRSVETEGYLQASERGERGNVTTYHLTSESRAVEQIARHILDEFPNRKFENELARVAQSIDLIVTLKSDRDRRKKRVTGVTEVIWDEENKQHLTKSIIRYSPVTEKYYYSSEITKELLLLMAEEDLEETRKLVKLLREREKQSPMSEYENLKHEVYDQIIGEIDHG